MSDTSIILWFSWFLMTHWLEAQTVLFKERISKGVNSMKKSFPLIMLLFLAAAVFLALPNSAAAQDDPPGRVARLNYIQGSVSFQPAGEQDWVDADRNRPLTTGDNLWADVNSRGEVHIGSTAIRLASETGISFLNIDDRTVQIQLAQGTIEVHVRRLEAGNAFEIDTPNLAFTLTRAGKYRIQTDPNGGQTNIIVREGEGEVTGAGESWDLVEGQQYEFDGTDDLAISNQPASGMDDFENWCQQRDQRENGSGSARYVSRDIDGYYDLDDNGDWRTDAEYGAVWYPRGVAYGWAPYHYGHWVWIAPWGWTWVGEEAWGYAPYHYGRWAFVGGYWGWVPGPIVVRPVYAPHLVAFVGGGGPNFAVGFGGGVVGVAWFPLGPRDVWVPTYHASARYVQNVNVTNTRVVNVVQVTNVYNTTIVNRSVTVTNYTYANQPGAVTAVRREDFVAARSAAKVAVTVSAEQVRNARPVEGASLAPTRSSYVSASAKPAAPSARPKVAFTDRKVVAKINPPVPPAGHHEPAIVNAAKPAPAPAKPPAEENRVAEPPPHTNAAPPPAKAVVSPPPPPARVNNEAQPAHPSTNFEKPVEKPQERPVEKPQERPQEQPQQHPAVKYAPPVKAKDEMYDVHPPLNNKPAPAPAPKAEEKKAAPPSKSEEKAPAKDKEKETKPPR
ncbi:MAG: DUF6600 domain-containing protein [Candidatus Acidiferrales bacterium]